MLYSFAKSIPDITYALQLESRYILRVNSSLNLMYSYHLLNVIIQAEGTREYISLIEIYKDNLESHNIITIVFYDLAWKCTDV